jgi:signal transduction histidine kinase
MHLHGGRLDVQSVEGKGSIFTLIFPYVPVRAASTVEAAV